MNAPPDIPEQFAFHECLGDRGHVAADKRFFRARPERVDITRHDFFARPRFAGNQNRDVVHRIALRQIYDIVNLRRFADNRRRFHGADRRAVFRNIIILRSQKLIQILHVLRLVTGKDGVRRTASDVVYEGIPRIAAAQRGIDKNKADLVSGDNRERTLRIGDGTAQMNGQSLAFEHLGDGCGRGIGRMDEKSYRFHEAIASAAPKER